MTDMGILAVIVNYRTPELSAKCLEALARERSPENPISAILVDGGSGDGSAQNLAEVAARAEFRDWVELLPLDFNGGFGWANNQAILHKARSETGLPELIYLLNPDAEVMPGAVAALKYLLQGNPRIGAAGSQLINTDGSPSASSFRFPSIGREFVRGSDTYLLHKMMGIGTTVHPLMTAGPVDWVTGASVMLRTDALADTGLFDDGFFLYFEEVELMYRLKRKGWSVWYEPLSLVKHIGGASTGVVTRSEPQSLPAYWFASRQRFFSLCHGQLRTVLTNATWLLAHYVIGQSRSVCSPRASLSKTPGEAAKITNIGIWPSGNDIVPSYPDIKDMPGTLPAWSTRR